jgi:hypothetical protein
MIRCERCGCKYFRINVPMIPDGVVEIDYKNMRIMRPRMLREVSNRASYTCLNCHHSFDDERDLETHNLSMDLVNTYGNKIFDDSLYFRAALSLEKDVWEEVDCYDK